MLLGINFATKRISCLKAVAAFVFRPRTFDAMAQKLVDDSRRLEDDSRRPESEGKRKDEAFLKHKAQIVRRAFWHSLLLVAFAIACGSFFGYLGGRLIGPISGSWSKALQYTGIGFLLWAVLGKQGWNIQTIGGKTLPELVNQWIYRGLCVVGSLFLAMAVAWPAS